MKTAKILLIEDDELASEFIYNFLEENGFSVTPVFTATDGVAYVKNNEFDIVLLDINLPDFNGFEVLKSLKFFNNIPIIVTSAYNDTKSKLLAFRYGASDYMVKPLDLEELEARIWVQLGKNSKIMTDNDKNPFVLQDNAIFFQQEKLNLTTLEFEILSTLIEHQDKVVSRDEIVQSLSSISSHRSLDNHIKNIRKKIGDDGVKTAYLKTVYGMGYTLKVN